MPNQNLKAVFSGYYDIQKMRIQAGNRIVVNFKVRNGIAVDRKEDKLDKEAQDILSRIRTAYSSMADAAADLPPMSKFKGNEIISSYTELVLADSYERLVDQEQRYEKHVKRIVHEDPFWQHWMQGVKGLGELMALVILAKVDIHKARHPSSLWKFCGLDVAGDGWGRSRRKEHMVMREYKNKDDEVDIREGISFQPWMKTKLIGVLGPSFLKSGNEKYAKIYYDYRNRLENHPRHGDGCERPPWVPKSKKYAPKLHRHNKAIRYMVKMFLIDLYSAWREFEGLPVSKPYHEAKLGH